jgi:hypothetical protein
MTGSAVFDELGPDGQFITDILNIETSVMQKKTMKDFYDRNAPTERANRTKKNQDKSKCLFMSRAQQKTKPNAQSPPQQWKVLYTKNTKKDRDDRGLVGPHQQKL